MKVRETTFSIRPPSRQELLRILRENANKAGDKGRRETEACEKADAALAEFKRTNSTYRRLKQKSEAARKRMYAANSKANEERGKLFSLVRLEGASKRVLQAINAILERQ